MTAIKHSAINAANTIYRILQAQYPSFSEKKKFTAYMIKHVRFVQIKTQEMGDALKVFETINQRGIGLTPMDLMKNMIFRQVSRSKFPELNAIWKSIIDCLQNGKTQESPLRFLRYYLMATYDTSDCPNGILREDSIYSWLVSKNNKCEYKTDPFGFVSRMKDGAERYMLYLSGGTNDPADNYIRNIPLIGGSAYKMHLLLLLAAKNMDAQAENHFKRVLESIVYYSTVRSTQDKEYVNGAGQTPLLSHEQLQRELSYRSSIALVRNMLNAGLISVSEFHAVKSKLAEQFPPIWGGLYQNNR